MNEKKRIVVEEDEPKNDVDEAPFEFRHVNIRKDKWFCDEFKVIDFLGRGKFGEVQRCVETSTGREFAAKFICTQRPQDRKDVEHEVNMMRKLRHRRLVQLYDAFEAKKEMCLVLEIIYGGELFDRVVNDDFFLTEKASVCLLRQICEGVDYMHSKNIIHLDLKPENILCLTKTGNRIKIIDFGLAREFDPKGDIRVMFGTPEFMAPEVVQYDPIDFSTDMWSIGVICYVLLSGLSPFMGDTDVETLSNVSKGKYDFGYPEFEKVSSESKDFISKLLIADKKKRITARQCLEHPWLLMNASNSFDNEIDKTKIKRFILRRRWQKAINVLIALRRMGLNLKKLQHSGINCHANLNCRTNKGWNAWNKTGKVEMEVKASLRKTPEPQVRTKGLTKVKVTDSETIRTATKTPPNIAQPSITDSVLDIPTNSNTTHHSVTTTTTTTTPISSPSSDSSSGEKSTEKKKCRKVVEHTTPGNGHVFNLAKVVSYKPRGIRPSHLDFDSWSNDEVKKTVTSQTGSKNSAKNDPTVVAPVNNCIDSSEAGSEVITGSQTTKVSERPKRNLMIRDKIRFFNQIDEPEPSFVKKNPFQFANKSS